MDLKREVIISPSMNSPQISIIKNFNEVVEITSLGIIINRIKKGEFSDEICKLRETIESGNVKLYNQQKKNLLSFTPSAVFEGGRKPEFLKTYNSLIILDIDKTNEKTEEIKDLACQIPYTLCCFVSPSGNGLKILIQTNSQENEHLAAFNQLKVMYEKYLNIKVDPSGKDITRLCFFSYDPNLFFNSEAQIYEVEKPKSIVEKKEIPFQDNNEKVKGLIDKIEELRLDITANYNEWCSIGFALESEFGEGGRSYFHSISQFNSGYNTEKCNEQYSKCLNNNKSGVKIATLFHIAKAYGFTPIRRKSIGTLIPPITSEYPTQEVKKKKNTTNRFVLAKKYLEQNYDVRNNIILHDLEFKIKDEKNFISLNEHTIYVDMQTHNLNIALNNLVSILRSGYVKEYNPFLEYFEGLPKWDEKYDYIQHLANFVGVAEKDRERFNNHFKKWLVRSIKCALIDTYFNKQAFILVHDKQNSGKSTFCRFLCPPALKNYIAENLSIDKDSRILMTTNFLINLDELSTLSKVEINALKSMFSKEKINDRLPYDRKNSIIPRRASFIGSTNQIEFLNDETGSVRWLCFEINEINWNYSKEVNIDLVYAQAYYLMKSDFKADLTPEELKENDRNNEQFQIFTTERELIHKYFESADKMEPGSEFMTASEIIIYIQQETKNAIKLFPSNVGKALKQLGFAKDKIKHAGISGYWLMKKSFNQPF